MVNAKDLLLNPHVDIIFPSSRWDPRMPAGFLRGRAGCAAGQALATSDTLQGTGKNRTRTGILT